MEITIYDSSATTGYYFLLPYKQVFPFPYEHPPLILDRYGRIVYYQILPGNSAFNFNLNPTGMMSYYDPVNETFWMMDSTFQVVDSILTMNGFDPDPHEFLVTEDHHKFILAKETRVMNLSGYTYFGINHNQPGSANAQVIGAVIQEFDENNNLVWEWKAHDHYAFDDVEPLWLRSPTLVDWTHANAIDQDFDGNILISLRHFNEITKINHQTGAIIWRLGGKANQFTFTNDLVGFTGQHDIRRLDNGNITLLDNGQYNAYSMARAVEYSLNESSYTANLVWEYIYDSTIFSSSLGSHQVLANGNHLIDFGTIPDEYPWMVVVKDDHSKVLELNCPGGYISYRAHNYETLPWLLNRPQIYCLKNGNSYLLEAEPGHTQYRWSTGAQTQSIPLMDTGTYWVCVPYGEGYISSEPLTVTDMSNPCQYVPAETLPEREELTLKISPNPATHHAIAEIHIPGPEPGIMTLMDVTGRSLDVISGNPIPPGTNRMILNTGEWQEGLYFLVLHAGRERIIRKLVIQ